jgi:hypothetical protein
MYYFKKIKSYFLIGNIPVVFCSTLQSNIKTGYENVREGAMKGEKGLGGNKIFIASLLCSVHLTGCFTHIILPNPSTPLQ